MSTHSPHLYKFDNFEFDADNHALYFRGKLIDDGGKKALQVMSVLMRNSKKLVAHQLLIDEVWGDDAFGVRPEHVNHYVSKIRNIFAEYSPDKEYIKNEKGRGYVFTCDVELVAKVGESVEKQDSQELTNAIDRVDTYSTSVDNRRNKLKPRIYVGALLMLTVLIASGYWKWFRSDDVEDVRRVITESQLFESLELYRKPAAFTEEDLDKYWVSDVDMNVNYDRRRIRESVRKLVNEGRRYGDETKCDRFEIQSININANGDFADVRTLEKWFIAEYLADGSLLKNRHVGPYFVSYNLRKIGGRWLIEKSSTARSIRPTPRLSDVQTISEVRSGQQFFANVTGLDFEPEFIFVEVIGPGCPESKPCKVPNSALRDHSKLSETEILQVPFTLASGSFKISVRNGESSPSNQMDIEIP